MALTEQEKLEMKKRFGGTGSSGSFDFDSAVESGFKQAEAKLQTKKQEGGSFLGRAFNKVGDFLGIEPMGKALHLTAEKAVGAIPGVETTSEKLDKTRDSFIDGINTLSQRIVTKIEAGEDVTEMQRVLNDSIKSFEALNKEILDYQTLGGTTTRDIVGGAISTASLLPATSAVEKGVGGAIKAGAVEGAIGGGLAGLGAGIQDEEKGIGEVASQTVGGALLGGAIGGAIPAVGAGVSGARKAISGGVEKVSRIPSRIGTNLAERQAQQEAIKLLPSKVARTAVRDGVDIRDVNRILELPKENSNVYKKVLELAKGVDEGKASPERLQEAVGLPVVNRMKTLESEASRIGKKLGKVSKNLGVVEKPELQTAIIKSLQKQRGLEGVTVSPNGKLDFRNTTISTNKSAQKNIQEAYTKATSWGNGHKAHLYRQELFEKLNGRKGAMNELVETEERALNAVREGIADVLNTKNTKYKDLNNQYRKIIQPLNELKRKLRQGAESTDDILNLKAGILARRITSNASTNADIRQLLQQLDEATSVKGKVKLETEALQNYYNILNRYYNLKPETSLAGTLDAQVPTDVQGAIIESIRSLTGRTDAVRQKALEDLIIQTF